MENTRNTNNFFTPGRITFLLDGGAGSSGKGKMASYIMKHADNWTFACNTFFPQASHTVVDGDKSYVYKQLNSCAHFIKGTGRVIYIGQGSVISLDALKKELEMTGLDHTQVKVHPLCAIVQDIDRLYEEGKLAFDGVTEVDHDGTIKTGCFADDTRILMADGSYKSIVDVEAGDRVINMAGQPVTVIRRIDSGIKKVMKVRNMAGMNDYHVTPDHLYWSGDIADLQKRKGIGNTLLRADRTGWHQIGSRGPKDLKLLTPSNINFELRGSIRVDMSEYVADVANTITETHIIPKGKNDYYNYNRYLEDSYELGYLFGAFLGDGCSLLYDHNNSGRVQFYLGLNEMHIVEKIRYSIKESWGADCKIKIRKNIILLTCWSRALAKFFSDFGKLGEKHLPREYWCDNEEYLLGIYEGLVDTDGHTTSRGSNNFTSSSRKLTELFNFLCLYMGQPFTSSISDHNVCSNHPNFSECDASTWSPKHCTSTITQNRQSGEFWYSNFKVIDPTLIDVQCWDLEVDCETHSFIANNVVVHNSTCSGVGAARARKLLRHPKKLYARDIDWLQPYLCEVEHEIMERLNDGESGLCEIAQGYQLSYGLNRFAPHTTSRNCTVSAALDDMMLPPSVVGNVVINFRTFPIRIHSNKYLSTDGEERHMTWEEVQNGEEGIDYIKIESPSGPGYDDQEEITWEDLTALSGSREPIMECTTLTKLPRRVFTFSKQNLTDSIYANYPGGTNEVFISVNFMNYLDAFATGARDEGLLNEVAMQWVKTNILPVVEKLGVSARVLLGTGADTEDVVDTHIR